MSVWHKLALSSLLILLSACQTTGLGQKWQVPSEDVSFLGTERRYGERVIPAELYFPKNAGGKRPLIITQHGSSRDGGAILKGKGRTDELSARLIKVATDRGFAVAVLDAFEGTGVRPGSKMKFPQAWKYAAQLRKKLAAHPRIDAQNLFYTGFSFGGGSVLNFLHAKALKTPPLWRGVAAAEPACSKINEAVKLPFAVMIIKGTESHYPPAPCALYRDMLEAAGNDVNYLLVAKANHFFSANGQIVDGIAVNGCSDNPVIHMSDGRLQFADGTEATREKFIKRCITRRAGAGKSREHLDFVVAQIVDFFSAQQVTK